MQALRNCSGSGTPSKIELNHNFYKRCPRAIYLENNAARYLVGVYFDCKNMNIYPAPGGPTEQTGFTIELFNYLDSIVAETRQKNESKQTTSTPTKPTRR